MNDLTSATITPRTIQEANFQMDSFFLSNSSEKNRIVYHSDGTISFIPKSPAYIVGEQILRPCIDNTIYYSSGLIRIISNSLNFLDTRLSSLFKIFPVAAAQSHIDSFESAVVPWNPKNPGSDFEAYARDLSLAQRNSLYQTPFFRDNFKVALTIKGNTIEFIDKIAQAYQIHEEALYRFCESYQNIYHKIDEIVRDLQSHDIHSKYTPFEEKTLILEFPEFVINPTPGGQSPSIVIREGRLSFNEKSLLPLILKSSNQEHQAVTEIKNRIKKKFLEGAGFDLDMFNIRKGTLPKDFVNLFSDERIEYLLQHVHKKRREVEQWVKNQETFLKELLDEKNLEMNKNIHKEINTLFELQKDMIKDCNKKQGEGYKIVQPSTTSNCEWKVIRPVRYFWEEQKFHFFIVGKECEKYGEL